MMYTHIITFLSSHNIPFQEITHEPTTSCEHSAELRKNAGLQGVGSKNIVFHAKGKFYLVTTLGHKDIKARKFKSEFGTKDIRFATQEEITALGLGVIGSIAPFGFQNEAIPLYIDSEIFDHEYFMFNPGDPTKTLQLKTTDFKNIYDSIKNPHTFFRVSEESIEFLSK